MKKQTFRVVTRGVDGELLIRDYDSAEEIQQQHVQTGTDDCSSDLDVRGMPVFQGLIGPMPEEDPDGKIYRYETPEVFEALTKKWCEIPIKRRRARKL